MKTRVMAQLRIDGVPREARLQFEHMVAAVTRVLDSEQEASPADRSHADFVFHGGAIKPPDTYVGFEYHEDKDTVWLHGNDNANHALMALVAQAYLRSIPNGKKERHGMLVVTYCVIPDDLTVGTLDAGFHLVSSDRILSRKLDNDVQNSMSFMIKDRR